MGDCRSIHPFTDPWIRFLEGHLLKPREGSADDGTERVADWIDPVTPTNMARDAWFERCRTSIGVFGKVAMQLRFFTSWNKNDAQQYPAVEMVDLCNAIMLVHLEVKVQNSVKKKLQTRWLSCNKFVGNLGQHKTSKPHQGTDSGRGRM